MGWTFSAITESPQKMWNQLIKAELDFENRSYSSKDMDDYLWLICLVQSIVFLEVVEIPPFNFQIFHIDCNTIKQKMLMLIKAEKSGIHH